MVPLNNSNLIDLYPHIDNNNLRGHQDPVNPQLTSKIMLVTHPRIVGAILLRHHLFHQHNRNIFLTPSPRVELTTYKQASKDPCWPEFEMKYSWACIPTSIHLAYISNPCP